MRKPETWYLAALGGMTALACSLVSLPGGERPTPVPPTPQTVPASQPTAAPTGPSGQQSRAFSAFICINESSPPYSWCLLDGTGAHEIVPPVEQPLFFDYAPLTNRVLYGSHFPNQGAGPGNKSAIDLWSVDLSTSEAQAVVETEAVLRARWAPNGEDAIYLLAAPDTYELRWRAASGEDRLLARDATWVFSASPEGERVAFTREPELMKVGSESGLYVVDVATGEERRIADIDRTGGGGLDDHPSWSPDGAQVALFMVTQNGPVTLLAAADGSASAFVTFDESLAGVFDYPDLPVDLLWAPDGRHVVGTLFAGGDDVGFATTVMLYELDTAAARVVAAEVVAEPGILLGWDVPGESVWIISTQPDRPPYSVPLP